jgi:PAS domain S-box-containing protein
MKKTDKKIADQSFNTDPRRRQIKKIFKDTDLAFKTIFDTAPVGILIAQANYRNFLYANEKMCDMMGYAKDEIVQLSVTDIHPEESLPYIFDQFDKMADKEISRSQNLPFLRKDKSVFYADGSALAISLHGEECLVGVFTEVTEIRQKEAALQASEQRFKSIVTTSQEWIWSIDVNGVCTFSNSAVENILGYRPEEIAGIRTSGNLIFEEDLPLVKEIFAQSIEQKKGWSDAVWCWKHKDGTIRYLESNAVPVFDSEGNVKGFQGTDRDITERIKAQEILAKSERKFSSTFHLNPNSMAISEVETGKLVDVNQSFISWTGFSREEAIGKSAVELQIWVDPEDRERITGALKVAGEVNGAEVIMRIKNGNVKNVLFSARYIEVDQNRYLLTLAQDITEMKKAQETLKISEENFRRSLDDSPLGVRVVSAEGKTNYANRALLDMFGYKDIGELKQTSAKDLYTPASYAAFLVRREKRRRGEDVPPEYEIDIIRRDRNIRHLQVFRKDILWNGETQFQLLYNDITGRKKAEELLKQSEAKYRLLADHMKDEVWLTDLDLNWKYISPSLEKLSGYSLEEFTRTPMRKIMTEKSFNETMEIFSTELPKVLATPSTYVFNRMLEIESVCKDGRIIWNEVTFSLIRDENGKPVYILFEGREVSERKLAQQKLQQTLESLKKAVGTTIQVLMAALESRDPYTAGHQFRSANLACAIAAEMGLDEDKIEGIRMAGSIHDIGKLSVPAEILSKPTRLTDLEYALVKEHSQNGYEMLKNVESPWPLADIVGQHHERINGSGYPHNLKKDDILIEARIMAVADVVEAMASHRPYRASLGIEAAINEIEKNRGILYDEDVVDALLRLVREKGYQLA